jgi:hypothetical protein
MGKSNRWQRITGRVKALNGTTPIREIGPVSDPEVFCIPSLNAVIND